MEISVYGRLFQPLLEKNYECDRTAIFTKCVSLFAGSSWIETHMLIYITNK